MIEYELSDGFVLDKSPAHGVDLTTKMEQVNERTYMLQCWVVDLTKDLESFHENYPKYLEGTQGAILIANLGDVNTLKILQEWISLIRGRAKGIPILLVGNRPKTDQDRQISEREGVQFAKEHDLEGYMEIASHSEFNTSIMFEKITSLILEYNKK